eukprot:CAMPEP_0184500494 /NCGR_PEP_ID=MMETSP0113_2-20130426/44948_1 /TAXON_ID=91329 /ORGANISM="Norrisiella sphaerica, Strain BC52" /LENGTH=698 /DNA_ID=CAMNT_0026888881 /DNA_START=53 /DNA_END=2146 /DNA_ORIENTATION=+
MDSEQKKVLASLLNTYTRRLSEEETRRVLRVTDHCRKSDDEHKAAKELCMREFTDYEGAMEAFDRIIRNYTPEEPKRELMRALWILSKPFGCFILTGHMCPFYDISPKEREQVLLSWSQSIIPQKRLLFKSFRGACHLLLTSHLTPAAHLPKPLEAIGYKIPRPLSPVPPYIELLARCELKIDSDTHLDADVVIVGSGVGGSMAARQLCLAGFKVLMIDKGEFVSMYHKNNSLQEMRMFERLYERGGPYLVTEDGNVTVLAGSTFGGGGTVNWFCSLRPPNYVREEWAQKFGLTQFNSSWFADCVDKSCELLGVQRRDMKAHSPGNQKLMDGCHRLGYHCEAAPQQGRPTGDEGLCGMGVKHGERQGMVGSLLLDAAKTNNLRYITGCRVDKVLVENGQAKGVCARTCDKRLNVTAAAKMVVSSCGSLQTPLLLKRSKLNNPFIGDNLRLHPVTGIYGEFQDDIVVYEGAPMTTVSNVKADRHGSGYGVRLETPAAHPAILAAATPWRGSVDLRESLLKLRKYAFVVVLTRDTSSGKVYQDKHNLPRLEYTMNQFDRSSMLEGMEVALNALIASGAKKVFTTQNGIPGYTVTDRRLDDPAYKSWLEKVRHTGVRDNMISLFSAHQMGTCKMGRSAREGVVRPSGETWEVDNLYVCDTSVFPTPSGVNPMVTVASVSYGIAQNMVERMGTLSAAKASQW